MWFNFIVLFACTFSPWLFFSLLPSAKQHVFKLILSFSGSYLFAITLLHILPEIYANTDNHILVGVFILIGFFLQLILSFFAQGVEHGHLHHTHDHDHSHAHHLPFALILSISAHAFLEGNMLVHPFHAHEVADNHSLLLGMVLHKIPEAFALLSILYGYHMNRWLALSLFVIYSLLSPLGMLCGTYAYVMEWMSPMVLTCLFALIAGNFMHISTVIFFESSPRHELKQQDTLAKIVGATCAVVFELLL
jgi:zinc and cadmium transporter